VNHLRATAAVAAVSLIAIAGCSRSGSSSSSGSSSTTASSAAPVAASTTSGGDFGTLKAVCGPGNATGATAPGVTNTEIDLSTMADPGNTVAPGLDQELFDTATAFMDWCNAAGGILGRKVVIHDRDAKLFMVNQQMVAACSDFALVGNGEAFDSAGVNTRLKCGLPEIPSYDDASEATEAPLKVQPAPNPIQQINVGYLRAAKYIAPNDTKVGIIVGNLAGVTTTGLRTKEAALAMGYTVPYYTLYPVTGIVNPESYVQQMKAAGVQIEIVVGDNSAQVLLDKAMQTLNWYPDVMTFGANFYDPNFPKNAGNALKNTWVGTAYYPFELAGQNPPTQQYVNILKAKVPGGKISALGVQGWDAWMLFATAAKACGSTLTRACLLQQAANEPNWTGGGVKPPVNTTTTGRQGAPCVLMLKVTAAGFAADTTALPPTAGNAPFNCDPANVIHLKTNYEPTDLPAGFSPQI
jgi:ABC-type branched-subunit amino acid transport system substrate-binding protein